MASALSCPRLLYCTHLTRALEVCEPELPPWPMMSGTKKDSSTCFDISASKSGHSIRRRWGSKATEAVVATVCSWMRQHSSGYCCISHQICLQSCSLVSYVLNS